MLQSKGEKSFQVVNYVFLSTLAIFMVYPFWEVIKTSISAPLEASRMGFRLWPRELSLEAYNMVMANEYIWIGYKNTLIRIAIGTGISMILMVLTAYPLSKKYFPNRNIWTMFVVFTMFFSGGLIPSYIMITKVLHLDNKVWALVLPGAINTFSMLIVRNYFMTIPESLEESARIDGASELTILLKIILPLSKPILMTVGLWGVVGNWNAWFDCLIYIRDSEKFVLQAILRKIIIDAAPQFDSTSAMFENTSEIRPAVETIKCATIIVSSLPIMISYPFVQKYFIKGVMVGSLKG